MVRRLRLALVSVAVGVAVAVGSACGPSPAGGGGGPRGPEGAELGLVVVVIVPTPEKLPFDPRGARLRAATAELGGIVGHPVTLVIDAGLAAEGRSSFESQLIEAVEGVARDLVELKKREPAAFDYGAPLLGKIVCQYRAVALEPTATLDVAAKAVTVVEAGHGRSLVNDGLVYNALAAAYDVFAEARYGTISPRDVPPAERRAYFELMSGSSATKGDVEPLWDKRSFTILKLIELAGLLGPSDPALAADLRKWLVGGRRHFTEAYVHHPEAVQGMAPAFHAAEKAWTEWLTSLLPTMTSDEKLQIFRDVFVRGLNGRGYVSYAFPGFDRVGPMLAVVDAWIAAGHPDTFATATAETALYEYVLCPHPKDDQGHRTMSPRCDHHLYTLVLENDTARKRLVEAILARKDPVLTETAFAAISHAQGLDGPLSRFFVLSHALEADDAAWTIGARVLAELADTGGPRVVDEVRRLWAAYPRRRAALLAVLAAADPYDNGTVDWRGFTHDFGAPLDEPTVSATLDFSPATLGHLPTMWPALGPGWPRARAVVPRLDRFLDGATGANGARDPQRPWTTFRALFNAMCAEGATGAADVADVRAYLVDRARTHPGDALVSLESEANCTGRTTHARAPAPTHPRSRGQQGKQ